jgi:c-di-GMP-binding flagellar brake protein YcgR
MTPDIRVERRRSPRYPVTGGEPAILPLSLSVQLLDISQTGVLLQSSQHAKEGSRGRLRFNLAGQPFSTEVEIRRVALGQGGSGYKIGARFVDLSEEHRQIIEGFSNR